MKLVIGFRELWQGARFAQRVLERGASLVASMSAGRRGTSRKKTLYVRGFARSRGIRRRDSRVTTTAMTTRRLRPIYYLLLANCYSLLTNNNLLLNTHRYDCYGCSYTHDLFFRHSASATMTTMTHHHHHFHNSPSASAAQIASGQPSTSSMFKRVCFIWVGFFLFLCLGGGAPTCVLIASSIFRRVCFIWAGFVLIVVRGRRRFAVRAGVCVRARPALRQWRRSRTCSAKLNASCGWLCGLGSTFRGGGSAWRLSRAQFRFIRLAVAVVSPFAHDDDDADDDELPTTAAATTMTTQP